MCESTVREADETAAGMERTRSILASGDATIAAYRFDRLVKAVKRVVAKKPSSG